MTKRFLGIVVLGLLLSACVTVNEDYLKNTGNIMLCAQSYQDKSLQTSEEDKEIIRRELKKRGVTCNGQGTYTYKDGKKYVGEWKGGKRHGQGILTSTKGYKYVGEFKDGKYNGQGTFTTANGNKYVGAFKDGKYNGQGTYTYADGRKYVGGFKKSEFYGHGTLTYADGRVEKGNWKKGKLVKSKEDKQIAKAKEICEKIGATPGTDKFIDCTIKLLTTSTAQQTVIVGNNQRRSIYPLHCRQMGGASNC